MKALRIYAGPKALQQLQQQRRLTPDMVRVIPGAAGGPKGLVLGPLDRFVFGDWLPRSTQPIHLVGGSIGAWRMATACLPDAVNAFERLERDYIRQDYLIPSGARRPTPQAVSRGFAENLQAFFGGHVAELLAHPRYHLHVVTSHGRGALARERRLLTPLGYLGAFVSNALHRKALSLWLERAVFSSAHQGLPAKLPFDAQDFRTLHLGLDERNFMAAMQASCSIPFMLEAVHYIPGAPRGAYWDGGITDYHLHLDYLPGVDSGIVLYPHFQKQVIPGWLDKTLRSRHRSTPALDRMLVLAPDPDWVRSLPNGKLPDRNDFVSYLNDTPARVRVWSEAVSASQQLADEFAQWLERPDLSRVEPL